MCSRCCSHLHRVHVTNVLGPICNKNDKMIKNAHKNLNGFIKTTARYEGSFVNFKSAAG